MEWNLKGGSWDLSELEEATLSNIEENTVNKDNNVVKNGEFCVDLKLGHHDDKVMGNSGISNSASEEGDGSVVSAPKTASSKRARGGGGGGNNNNNGGSQTASCLVDGCEADLSNCRDYHRRHKVCELHSKTPVVTIGGHKQRFCQQCSRFHSLEEFDEGKRSCRKRLDGHNRRRRKPQPVPLTRSPSFFSNYQGTQVVPLCSSSHVYPSSGCDGRFHHHQQHQQVPKQGLFLGSMATPTHAYNNINNNHKQLMNNHHLQAPPATTTTTTTNPLCALSLLSSSSSSSPNMPLVHPLGLSLHDQTLDLHSHVDDDHSNALVNNNQSIHHPSIYTNMHMPSHASSHANQPTHPSLPFHWE